MLFAIFRFWFDCMFNLGSMQLFDVCGFAACFLFVRRRRAMDDERKKVYFQTNWKLSPTDGAMWANMIDGVNGRN